MNEFSIGVVSGLVTSLIVFVLQLLYLRVLMPWIEDLLYRDLKIEGHWLVEYPEAKGFTEAIVLRRQGHRIMGSVTVTGGPDSGRVYLLEGSFKNLILTVSFHGQDQSRLDRGTYTLQVHNNGQHFSGFSAFYQDEENKVSCLQCNWKRS